MLRQPEPERPRLFIEEVEDDVRFGTPVSAAGDLRGVLVVISPTDEAVEE